MKHFFYFLFLLQISFISFGQIPNGYYNNAEGKTGYTLKTVLFNIVKNGHQTQSYGDLYNAYVTGDTDPEDGFVWDIYSENPNGTDPYNYSHHNKTCGNYASEGDCYNREHLFPQGIFNSNSPMKTDYHHVVPSDGKVNGMRSSYPFGEVGTASWTSMNGSKKGSCASPGYSGTVFEPIDDYKGDIARSMLYFATRYEDKVSSWSHAMIDGTSDQVYSDWFLDVLLKWHEQDPVSQKEIVRNNAGYDFQGNRNPFIDHPEYVCQIWGANCNPTKVATPTFSIEEGIYYNTQNVSISCATTDAQIYYKLDNGSSFTKYTSAINFENTTTITAYATKTDLENSDEIAKTFTIQLSKVAFSAASGTYSNNFELRLRSESNGAAIHYKKTGETDFSIYSTPLQIENNCSIIAYSSKSGFSNSSEVNNYYNMEVSQPVFNTAEGIYFPTCTVTISCETPEVKIYYTTNGTTPSHQSTLYTGPFTIAETSTVKCIGVKDDWFSSQISSATYTINSVKTILEEDFESQSSHSDINLNGWTNIIENGTRKWQARTYNNNLYAQFSSYQSNDAANTAWLVSPELDLTNLNNIIFSFKTKDGFNKGDVLDVLISENYNSVDPSIATWNPINAKIASGTPSGYAPSFTESGDIDLSAYKNKTIHIAFKYHSQTDAGITTTMQVDDILVKAEDATNIAPVINSISSSVNIIQPGESVNIVAEIVDPNQNIEKAELLWSYNKNDLSNIVLMTNKDNIFNAQITSSITGTIFFKIKAIDTEGLISESVIKEITVSNNSAPEITEITYSPNEPIVGTELKVFANISDIDGTITSAKILWSFNESSLSNEKAFTVNDGKYEVIITPEQTGSLYYKIEASDNDNASTESPIATIEIKPQNQAPVLTNIISTPDNPKVNTSVHISAEINDSDGVISSAKLFWSYNESNFNNVNTLSENAGRFEVSITPDQVGIIYYKLEATDNENASNESTVRTITVTANNVLPVISEISYSPQNPIEGNSLNISAKVTDSDGIIEQVFLKWGNSQNNMDQSIEMENDNNIYLTELSNISEGNVYFIITATDNENETTQSEIQAVSVLTSIETNLNESLNIYPNPAENWVYIETNSIIKKITILDLSGKTVKHCMPNKSKCNFNISSLENGVYFLQVQNKNETVTQKIIIKK